MEKDQNPDLIYHYTNLEAFLRIVENQCLWASDLDSVNDPAELLHIRAEFERVIGCRLSGRLRRRRIGQESESTEYAAFLDRLSNLWPGETLYGRPDFRLRIHMGHVFGVSFCNRPDLLSQWRAYGLQGGGICVGFESEVLAKSFGTDVELDTVEYQQSGKDEYMKELLEVAFAKYQEQIRESTRHPQNRDNRVIEDLEYLLTRLSEDAHRFKIKAFDDEQERRLVLRIPYLGDEVRRRVRVRANGGKLIPYVELRPLSGRLPLKRVITGPAYLSQSANYALEGFLQRNDFPVSIEPSQYTIR